MAASSSASASCVGTPGEVGANGSSVSRFRWNVFPLKLVPKDPKDVLLGSEVFVVSPHEAIKWQLTLRPEAGRDCFALHLNLIEPQEDRVEVQVKVQMVINHGDGVSVVYKDRMFGHQFTRNSLVSSLPGLLSFMSLTGNASIITLDVIFESLVHSRIGSRFAKIFDMFKDQTLTDVVIKVGEDGEEIGVHKVILVSKSSVFEAMFQPHTEESQTNVIKIKDMKMNVVKEMLNFIYSEKVQDQSLLGSDLLYGAEKYDLQGLKSLCEEFLESSLSFENAVDVLITADRYKTERLRKVSVGFIAKKSKQMRQSKDWKEKMYKRPDLMDEIIGHLEG